MNSDNKNATVLQVAPINCGDTVQYLNPSSEPNLVGGAMPGKVSLTAPKTVGGPKVVPAGTSATLRTEPTVFAVRDCWWRSQEIPSTRVETRPM